MRYTVQGHKAQRSADSNESQQKRKLQWDVKKPVVYSGKGLPLLQSDRRAIKKAVYSLESQES